MVWGLPFFFGPSLLILLPALAFAIYAQWKVRSTYARYARVESGRGITAESVARHLLDGAQIHDVQIGQTPRRLSDHYDPRRKILRLSAPESSSIAAIGVAAHEAGHAIQHARAYKPLSLRTAIVPVASFGSQLAFPLFLVGLFARYQPLVTAGIALFSVAVLFTLLTLPVEFDASRRAVGALREAVLVSEEELGAVKEVLFAAALTYVAAAAMAALQLVMLLSIGRRR
jgi:Zn-dependent membrane protease YugP